MTLEKQAHETDVSKQVTSFRKSPVRSICARGKERGEEGGGREGTGDQEKAREGKEKGRKEAKHGEAGMICCFVNGVRGASFRA